MKSVRGTRSSGRSTSAQTRPFHAIPRNSVTRTCPPGKYHPVDAYILPVLLYGSETWNETEVMRQCLDAFDQWCLCHIIHIPYTAHLSHISICSQTYQPPVSSLIKQRRLKLFGHTARSAPMKDHTRALRASTGRLPADWCCPIVRPCQSWLCTDKHDLKPFNLVLHSTLWWAGHCSSYQCIVESAMLSEHATWWWWLHKLRIWRDKVEKKYRTIQDSELLASLT